MVGDQAHGVSSVERLARQYFELTATGADPRVLDVLHPDVEIRLRKLGGPRTLRGRQEVAAFLEELPERFPVFEAMAEDFKPVDDERIVVEGRMRWMDAERVLRDDPMIWALEFRDSLLFRSCSARSVIEAQAILAAGAPPDISEAESEA
jgi:ketosteroid isomerase-like protein